MSTAGIVAEYNPFHNGHAYHITRTRENGASAVVCVMSSWFVQRGETALMHPNARARMALMNGADLVVSLPVPWACAAAQTFARGAVGLLDAMGCVDTLSFGSECADVTLLRAASRAVDDYTVRESLRANLLSGVSFASARQRAVEELDPRVASVLSSPNDTLAVEYIRAIDKLKSDLTPFAVKREGAGQDRDRSGQSAGRYPRPRKSRPRLPARLEFGENSGGAGYLGGARKPHIFRLAQRILARGALFAHKDEALFPCAYKARDCGAFARDRGV